MLIQGVTELLNRYTAKTLIDYLLLVIAWSATTQLYAQQVTFGGDLETIPIKSLVYVGVLAFLGGLASTLQKFADPNVVVPHISVELAKDLVLSLVAGAIAFFMAEQTHAPVMVEASAITVAGWAGSKWLDKAAMQILGLKVRTEGSDSKD